MSKKISLLVILIFIGVIGVTSAVYAVTSKTSTKTVEEPIVNEEVMAISEENKQNEEIAVTNSSSGIGLIAAALAIGLSAIGSGIAVAVVASSAVGAVSENPSLLGKTVIFAGLAEGIAIYGLIVAIMIISKV